MSDSMLSSYNLNSSLKISKLKPLQNWLPRIKTDTQIKLPDTFDNFAPPKALISKRTHEQASLKSTTMPSSYDYGKKHNHQKQYASTASLGGHPNTRLLPFTSAKPHSQPVLHPKKADSTATLFELDREFEHPTYSSKSFKLPPINTKPKSVIDTDGLPTRYRRSESSVTLHQQTQRLGLSPERALVEYALVLSDYERKEIAHYNEIYFVGLPKISKLGPHQRYAVPTLTASNDDEEDVELANQQSYVNRGAGGPEQCHFDDIRGDYKIVKDDHLGYRYQIVDILGKGSFGQVVKAIDHKTNTQVAVKIIRNETRFEKQALVELQVLEQIAQEDTRSGTQNYIVHIRDSFKFRNHMCIAFDLMGKNLYEWVKNGDFQGLHLGFVKSIAYQILNCLRLLETQRIVHCDLKPENILLKSSSSDRPAPGDIHTATNGGRMKGNMLNFLDQAHEIQVIDFGSACRTDSKVFTYIQSRFYRSPEVILGLDYNTAIDMWSLGCILVELYTGYPLFPGENEQDQLHCIMEVCGLPPSHILSKATRRRLFFDSNRNPRPFTNSRGRSRRPGTKSLYDITRTHDSQFLKFVKMCLDWDPESRLKPATALEHPWFAELHASNAAASNDTLVYKSAGIVSPSRGAHGYSFLPPQSSGRVSNSGSVGDLSLSNYMSKNLSASSSSSSLFSDKSCTESASIKSETSDTPVDLAKPAGSKYAKPVFALSSSILSTVPVNVSMASTATEYKTLDGLKKNMHHPAGPRQMYIAPKVSKNVPSPFSRSAHPSDNSNIYKQSSSNVDVFKSVKNFFVGNF